MLSLRIAPLRRIGDDRDLFAIRPEKIERQLVHGTLQPKQRREMRLVSDPSAECQNFMERPTEQRFGTGAASISPACCSP